MLAQLKWTAYPTYIQWWNKPQKIHTYAYCMVRMCKAKDAQRQNEEEGERKRQKQENAEDRKSNNQWHWRRRQQQQQGTFYAEMHTKTFTIFSHVLMSYSEKDKTLVFLITVNDKFRWCRILKIPRAHQSPTIKRVCNIFNDTTAIHPRFPFYLNACLYGIWKIEKWHSKKICYFFFWLFNWFQLH